jgi:hypothetical protein
MVQFSLVAAFAVVAFAAFAAGGTSGSTQDAGGAATPTVESAGVAASRAALNAHEPERLAALDAEDAKVEQAVANGNVFRDREEIGDWVADNLPGVPGLSVSTGSTVVEGDRIAWARVYPGTYTGRYPGLPADEGQPFELRGVSRLTVRDGLITRETVYVDYASFLARVGPQPEPGLLRSTPAS